VYHFYLWPTAERRQQDGLLAFKVTAELQGTEAETREVMRSFIALWFDQA
jgi:hypothetical protein